MIDGPLMDDLRALIERKRAYASLREGGTKRQKEFGVLADLLESMSAAGKHRYTDPAVVLDDPPDCTVRTLAGGLVAVEVSEFVSQAAIEGNERIRRELKRRPTIEEMVAA